MSAVKLGKTLMLLSNSFCYRILPCRTEFTSAFNLKNLYPQSSLKITTPAVSSITEKNDPETFSGYIPLDKIKFKYSLSSGPGGMNRDHIKTKVELRFNLSSADWIPEKVRQKLLETKKSHLTKEGNLIIRSDKTRSQQLNKADVLQRLRCIIHHAIREMETPPEPSAETLDEIRKKAEKANRERLRTKRLHSMIKESRRNVD